MIHGYSDAHIHIYHHRWAGRSIDEILKESKQRSINYFLGAGYSPEDWQPQLNLAQNNKGYFPVLGLHPMWVAHQSEEILENALSVLPKNMRGLFAIGELGLDLRTAYEGGYDLQIEAFRSQLEMAQFSNLGVVLHIVRAHEESLRLMDLVGLPKRGGMVHAFNGDLQKMRQFYDRGLYISFGSAVTYEKNKKLHEAIKKMNWDRFLVETDSPDQPPEDWNHPYNLPESIYRVAQVIGSLRGIREEEVLEQATKNLFNLFPEMGQK